MLYDVDIEASACVLSSRYAMLCLVPDCFRFSSQTPLWRQKCLFLLYQISDFICMCKSAFSQCVSPTSTCLCIVFMLCIGKGEPQLSTLMDRLRARSLHRTSWIETVKVLNTSLSAVSGAVVLFSRERPMQTSVSRTSASRLCIRTLAC